MQSSIQSLMLSLTHSLNVSFFHAIIHSIIHAFFLSLIQLLNLSFFSSNHPFNYSRFLSFTHSITQSFFLSFKMADAHVLASAVFVTHSALLNATCIFFVKPITFCNFTRTTNVSEKRLPRTTARYAADPLHGSVYRSLARATTTQHGGQCSAPWPATVG